MDIPNHLIWGKLYRANLNFITFHSHLLSFSSYPHNNKAHFFVSERNVIIKLKCYHDYSTHQWATDKGGNIPRPIFIISCAFFTSPNDNRSQVGCQGPTEHISRFQTENFPVLEVSYCDALPFTVGAHELHQPKLN